MSKFYYNGVLLPEIPSDVLAEYPYCWIRKNTTTGYYDLVFASVPWYYNSYLYPSNDVSEPWYRVSISTASSATEWTFNNTTTGSFGLDDKRTILWSNHNIPNGSATSTNIYFYTTELVGENDVKPKELTYSVYVDFFVISGGISYSVDSQTINYVVPVAKYSTYTVTMTEVGNRLRCVFTTIDPSTITANVTGCVDVVMNPTFNEGYQFTHTATENGWLVVYVSNAGEKPKIRIVSDGVGGDGSPLYARRYLIKSENNVHTVVDGVLTLLEVTELKAETFQMYGFDELPEWSIVSELVNPELLYWHDSLDDLPTITATMTATPHRQTLIAEPFYLIDATILGIESVVCEYAGQPSIALSFDGGDFEYYDESNGWVTASDTEGMVPSVLTGISTDTWSEKVADVQSIQIRVILNSSSDSLTSIKFNFINQ